MNYVEIFMDGERTYLRHFRESDFTLQNGLFRAAFVDIILENNQQINKVFNVKRKEICIQFLELKSLFS